MFVFFVAFLMLPIIHLITLKMRNKKKGRIYETIFCFIILWLIQGLRHEDIGVDWYIAYRPFFENLDVSNFSLDGVNFGFEPGFVILSKFIKFFISTNPQIYALICSLLFIAPIAYLFYKYSPNISFSFLIFGTMIIYHFGFSGIRQAIAIGITAISFNYVLKRKLLPFLIIVLLASAIHTSAFMFIITYPIFCYMKLDRRRLIILMAVFSIMITFLKPIAEMALNVLFIGDVYSNKLNQAEESPSYNMIIIFLSILFFSYSGKDSRKILPYRGLLFFMTAFQTLALITTTGARMAYYFIPYVCLVLPMILEGYNRNMRIIVSTGIGAFLIFFFIYVNGGGYLDVIPYKFFWE